MIDGFSSSRPIIGCMSGVIGLNPAHSSVTREIANPGAISSAADRTRASPSDVVDESKPVISIVLPAIVTPDDLGTR
jgi:hypothetical protein